VVKHRGKIDYRTVQCADFGVPQHRTRLVAGPPALIQALGEIKKTRRVTIAEAFNEAGVAMVSKAVRNTAQLRSTDGPCTRPVSMPAYTVLTRPLKWDMGEGQRGKTLSVSEMAILQTFPRTYKFPSRKYDAYRVIGNAVPCKLGLAILAAAAGTTNFQIEVPPPIQYVETANTSDEGAPSAPAPEVDARLSRLEGELSEIKAMLAEALSRKKRRKR
jgi:hypothetical protein